MEHALLIGVGAEYQTGAGGIRIINIELLEGQQLFPVFIPADDLLNLRVPEGKAAAQGLRHLQGESCLGNRPVHIGKVFIVCASAALQGRELQHIRGIDRSAEQGDQRRGNKNTKGFFPVFHRFTLLFRSFHFQKIRIVHMVQGI